MIIPKENSLFSRCNRVADLDLFSIFGRIQIQSLH